MSKYYIEIDVPLMSLEWSERIVKVVEKAFQDKANIRKIRVLSEKELTDESKGNN